MIKRISSDRTKADSDLQTIAHSSSPTIGNTHVVSSLSPVNINKIKKIAAFFKSKEITDTHLKVLQIIVICQVVTTLFALFILPLLCHK